MKFQRFSSDDSKNAIPNSTGKFQALVRHALSDDKRVEDQHRLKLFAQIISTRLLRMFTDWGNTPTSMALIHSGEPAQAEYRLTEQVAGSGLSETSLVVARPALLQLVTDSVPAIDLDDRQHLVRSLMEMTRKMDANELTEQNSAIQPSQHRVPPVVTIVEPIISADAQTLKHLFQTQKLLTNTPLHQAKSQPSNVAIANSRI